MRQTFGPVIIHDPDTGSVDRSDFDARCYSSGFDCSFRVGDTCTHVTPSRKIDGLPATPDWCEMKAAMISDAQEMARAQATRQES